MAINEADCDTKKPYNLNDDEFDMLTISSLTTEQILPPVKRHTEMSFTLVRLQISDFQTRVLRTVYGLQPPAYENVMKLDAEIRHAMVELSPNFDRRIALLGGMPPLCRLQTHLLSGLYLRCLILLHQPYFREAIWQPPKAEKYSRSKEAALDASRQFLKSCIIAQADNELQATFRWYIDGTIFYHVVHASSLIALNLYMSNATEDWEADWTLLTQSMGLHGFKSESQVAARSRSLLSPLVSKVKEKLQKISKPDTNVESRPETSDTPFGNPPGSSTIFGEGFSWVKYCYIFSLF